MNVQETSEIRELIDDEIAAVGGGLSEEGIVAGGGCVYRSPLKPGSTNYPPSFLTP